NDRRRIGRKMSEQSSQVIKQRQEKAAALKEQGLNLYPNHFRPRDSVADLKQTLAAVVQARLDREPVVFTLGGQVAGRPEVRPGLVRFGLAEGRASITVLAPLDGLPAAQRDRLEALEIGQKVTLTGRPALEGPYLVWEATSLSEAEPDQTIEGLREWHRGPLLAELEAHDRVYVLAGRIMARRDYGGSTFFDFKDHTGRFQGFLQKKGVSAEEFELFRKLDLGDLVGLTGRLTLTRTLEPTLVVERVELVTKSLLPLPEKYHEMSVELRYRQRYLDLIMNDRGREVFLVRARVVSALRRFLSEKGFIEVETPMMQPIPGGATARPFVTHHQALDMTLYLRIAPELYLKRLLVGGYDRVFELNRNFRNEGISTQHNPEFTMLEFYQAYADFEDMMDLSEEMFLFVAREVKGAETLVYQGMEVNLARPWRRIGFHQALSEIGGVPEEVLSDRTAALGYCRSLGAEASAGEVHGKILAKLFDLLVEPGLSDPTFVTYYPADISPLARRNGADPELTDRFELFIAGREMANGFSELNDPLDQQGRFEAQAAEREAGDEEAQFMDEDYVRALMYGMPPAGGEGVGVDRLVMLLADVPSIKDVILFPHLRPER
ncbi:MAG: lysine--tRNA ligase, partial [Thermodesulfobacteriota bacterium]